MPKKNLADILDENMREYGTTVISERAIPSIVDGLKPTPRRALFTAYRHYRNQRVKVSTLAGRSVELVPTGDSSIASAISSMAREWPGSNNFALLKPTGAVGSRVFDGGESIAAPRYLSVELSDFARKYLFVDSEIWEEVPSYDEATTDLKFYLPVLPMCLLNGAQGIAFGVATNILPYSPKDLTRVIKDILTKKKNIKEPVPWFRNFRGTIATDMPGTRFTCTGKVEAQDPKTWVVTDLPIGQNSERFTRHLDRLKSGGHIYGYDDESTDKHRFIVHTKKNQYQESEMIDILKLRTKLSQNLNVLNYDKTLLTYTNVVDLLRHFVELRMEALFVLKNHWIKYYQIKIAELTVKVECLKVEPLQSQVKTKAELLDFYDDLTCNIDNYEKWMVEKVVELPRYHWVDEYRKKADSDLKKAETELAVWTKKDMEALFISRLEELCKEM